MARANTRARTAALLAATAALAVPAAGALARGADGTISNAAGTPGKAGFAGDGGPAGQALLAAPSDVAFAGSDTYLIADSVNDRIRRVGGNGAIATVAGGGSCGGPGCGDGGLATDAQLDRPAGVTALPAGGYLIADTRDNRVRRVAPDGTIATVAGTTGGFGGDGGPATAAKLSAPGDTAVLSDGSYLIADSGNDRIRRVAPNGTIATVAGTGAGFAGDGGPATAARLNAPQDVEPASDGGFLIADTGNNRIRRVAPDGTIVTLAGSGTGAGLAGDGDPARNARLSGPRSAVALPNGGVLFSDTGNARVRRITPLGTIFTVAGTTPGNAGNGGLARNAQLAAPGGLALAPGGGFLVADTGNAAIRAISDIGAIPPARLRHSLNVAPATGNVLVRPFGTATYLPLREDDLVQLGSAVDATSGRLTLTTASSAGRLQAAQAFAGPFTVRQTGGRRPAFTDLVLPALTGCPRARATASHHGPLASAARRRRRRVGVSKFGTRVRTVTGAVIAAGLGTEWFTIEYCTGTQIVVRRGRVRVFDRVRHRTRIVRAGRSFFVRARKAR